MRVNIIADLLKDNVSAARVDAALIAAAPVALRYCGTTGAPLSASILRDLVITKLRDALQIGIPEAILRWWIPVQTDPGPWPSNVLLTRRPILEWMSDGLPRDLLRLKVQFYLKQEASVIVWSALENQLVCGEERAWRAKLSIGLGDAEHGSNRSAEFYDSITDIYLPASPWKQRF